MAQVSTTDLAHVLPGIDEHPHARALLGGALAPGGNPSHAYLFHGLAGSGMHTIARAFAAALLSDGAEDPERVAERVSRGTHPDLIWVTPSGATEMLVSDIDEPVIAAATRTPFESKRRVFVIESAQAMNDQAANRLLKTLEEPPSFVHLILLVDRREDVLATIASRCQLVRFDPLSGEHIARLLVDAGVEPDRARACANLSLGDTDLAQWLATEHGQTVRANAESFVRSSLSARTAKRPWTALLDTAKAQGEQAGETLKEEREGELELLPSKEHRRHLREGGEAQRRLERRIRTRSLDRALRLSELWLRDLWCAAIGAEQLMYAVDRAEELRDEASKVDAGRLREGVELVADTRLRLTVNVSEALALEALCYRLSDLGGALSAT
jgi:DNA polymerase-3 subunit delta'